MVSSWLAANRAQIEVFYLPPYSPEFNPSECFNRDPKGPIQRGIPKKDLSELKCTILGHSCWIQKSPSRLRSYLKHKHIRYAA